MSVTILNEVRCTLGEGPAWDAPSQTLFWTDIDGQAVHAAAADGQRQAFWNTALPPSAVIPATKGKVLVTAGQEVLELCTASGEIAPKIQLWGEPASNRCNDAKCDPFGNLWIGTMDSDRVQRQGRLWRVSPAGDAAVILDGIGISNTLAWDTERNRFYFADSMQGDIYVFDVDPGTAEISDQRLFFAEAEAPGEPDGSAIDAEGYLWNARWDGGCVVRIAPDGRVDRVIELPVIRPTSCAFGGADLKTLFVTSALSPQEHPDDCGGAVLSIDVGVPGAPVRRYERELS